MPSTLHPQDNKIPKPFSSSIKHVSQQVPSPISYLRWKTFQSLLVLFQEQAPSSLAPIDTPISQSRSKKYSQIYCTDLKLLEKRSPSFQIPPSNPSSKSHWSSLVEALKPKLQQVPLLWTNMTNRNPPSDHACINQTPILFLITINIFQ